MALVGNIVLRLFDWAMPGLSGFWLYGLAGLMAIGLVASLAYSQGTEGKAAAIATERAACEVSKSETARQAAVTMADLLDRIAKAEDETGTAAELCNRDPFCKRGKK